MWKAPILCYHNVAPAPATSRLPLLYVSPSQFDRQLWTLRSLGLRGISMREATQPTKKGPVRRSVVLTFDDGFVDTLTEAAPLLRRYGFTATCYVVSDAVGAHNHWDGAYGTERKTLMTREQLQQWQEAGMEIGSHSCSHPWLNKLSDDAAYAEIADSRANLRRAFNAPVDHFCYPFGGFTRRTAELVRRAGYRSAVTTQRGIACEADDPFRLPRIFVLGTSGWWKFLLRVATPYEDLRRPRAADENQ
jgi:peptidoglycan/xylan/chitin deacetylase (PgdA/CDA1 family)